MLLISHDRLHAAHQARSAAELNSSDHFVLPSIVSTARTMPANRRVASMASPHRHAGSLSPTSIRRAATVASPSKLGAMSLAEIAKVGPSTLEALKFTDVSGPRKGVSIGQPQGGDSEAALEKELEKLSQPGPQEKQMSDEQRQLVADVRTEVLMFKPNKVVLLNKLHDLVELLVVDVSKRESTIGSLNKKLADKEDIFATAKQHADEEIHKRDIIISDKHKQIMQGELQRNELLETIKGLKERLNTAAGIGMTAEEAARTMMQLTKAKASIEAMKKQIGALEDKVGCV